MSNQSDEATLPAVPASGALRSLKKDLTDNFKQVINIRLIGDSITWGLGASNSAPQEPRKHSLGDVRNNFTSKCWANLFRDYLGLTYLGADAALMTDCAKGSAYYAKNIDLQLTDAHFSFKFADGNSFVPAIVKNSGYVFGQAWNVAPRHGKKAGFEFSLYGDSIILLYAPAANSRYELFVDDASQGIFDANGTNQYGSVRTHAFALGSHKVRFENVDVAGSSPFMVEGIRMPRKIRVANDGIIGTYTKEWLPASGTLITAVTDADEYVICTIGVNDRGQALPYTIQNMYDNLNAIFAYLKTTKNKKVIAATTPFVTRDESKFRFPMAEVAKKTAAVAKANGIDFVDQYGIIMQWRTGNPEAIVLFDGLHPNDAGYALMFNNIKTALEESDQCKSALDDGPGTSAHGAKR